MSWKYCVENIRNHCLNGWISALNVINRIDDPSFNTWKGIDEFTDDERPDRAPVEVRPLSGIRMARLSAFADERADQFL